MAFLLPALAGDSIFASGLAQAASNLAPYGFLLFLLPIPFSLFNSWRKRKQLDAQQDINSIRSLSWQRFEELVGEAYRRQGYRVLENDSAGPDGGIDHSQTNPRRATGNAYQGSTKKTYHYDH